MPDSALSTGQATARDMLGALPLVSKRNYQPTLGCQVNFETLLYLRSCQRAKRQNSCCSWGGLCKPTATRANSAPPNGWRSAFLLAPTRSPGPRPHSRTFKQRPVAPHRKPSRRLRRVGIWFGSDRRLMDEASRSARPASANRDARRPAPCADQLSREWNASALWRVPGVRPPQWRNQLQIEEREPIDP